MNCSDKFVNYLKEYGYSVIRLPKADIEPLQMLVENRGDLVRLGSLGTVLDFGGSGGAPSPPTTTRHAANVSGQRTGDLSIGLGLSILGPIIGAMGGSNLGLDANYRTARTIAFEFDKVEEESIEIADLDQHLAAADINPHSIHIAHLLESDRIYVTTAVLRSRRLTVEAKAAKGEDLAISVPVVQQAIGTTVKVTSASEAGSTLTYEGPIPLAFGFQAVQLFYSKGRYTSFKPLGLDKKMRSLGSTPVDGAERLSPVGPFVRLQTWPAV